MAQWLRALAVLAENLGSHTATHNLLLTPIPRGSDALFWPPWALHACGAHNPHSDKASIHIKIKHQREF